MQIKQGKPCNALNYSSRGGAKIQYIVVHYTAGNGDTAQNNCTFYANGSRNASAHYYVGEDGIYQSVPDNLKAWHCGGTSVYKHPYCRNANSIGVEMCSRKNASGEYYIVNSVVAQTIELVKYLMQKYNIPVTNVIRHYDVWAKACPAPFVKHPEQWQKFKADLTKGADEPMTTEERTKFNELVHAVSDLTSRVDALTKPEMIYNYIDKNIPPWAVDAVKWAKDSGIIEGDERGLLNLTDIKLWMLIVLYRAAKWVCRQVNVKI